MKKLTTNILAAAALLCCASCADMLDTKSGAYIFDEDLTLGSANDSVYSVMGILTKMQQLGERYVLLGELRGDLVTVQPTAAVALQRLGNFEAFVDEDQTLGAKSDYYSVINNCNIALARMDTTVTERGTQVMLPEYAAIKTMRDWTFLQLGLAYGKAVFTETPVLNVDDTAASTVETPLDALVVKLIADLEPLAAVSTPNYGSIDGLSSNLFFIKPALLLGDLYLYNGNYERAAAMYYKIINDGGYVVSTDYANRWTTSVRSEYVRAHHQTYSSEAVVEIPYASDGGEYHPNMVNLTYNTTPGFTPAQWFVNDMNAAQHFHIDRLGINNITGYLEGDLRGMFVTRTGATQMSAFGYSDASTQTNQLLVSKFAVNGSTYSSVSNPANPLMEDGAVISRFVALYRVPHLYLRYAEAVNRAGKPSLAFAVLKYGLRSEVLADSTKVDPTELEDNVEWTNFSDSRFNSNYGTAMRGRGLGIAVETSSYILPDTDDRDELVEWVEEKILDEMAAETCFEGNRFFDLLRISRHRANHPAFMAEKIARRFDNPTQIEAWLSDVNNLWIK